MFNKGQRIDKLVIRNQVGYHFKKVIREVSQELFVSRKVDLSALLHGIQILEQTKDTMKQYCYDLAYAEASSANKPTSTPDSRSPTKDHIPHAGQRYVSIVSPMLSGFAEAKAKCTALGMKLPEIYTMDQREELRTFLREAGVTICFAGLQADIPDSTFRFISTGVPIWQGPFDKAYGSDGHEFELVSIMDDANAKFIYTTSEWGFGIRFDHTSIINNPDKHNYGSHRYRDTVRKVSDMAYPIICEKAWDGSLLPPLRSADKSNLAVTPIRTKRTPKLRTPDMPSETLELSQNRVLREYCLSVATQAGDIQEDLFKKISNLLSLVDISFHLENNQRIELRESPTIEEYQDPMVTWGPNDTLTLHEVTEATSSEDASILRYKRIPVFLAKTVFTNGVKAIWGIYSMVQKMRADKKMKKLETSISGVQSQMDNHEDIIRNLTLIAYGSTIAIEQLNVTTRLMDARIHGLEGQVDSLASSVKHLDNRIDSTIQISLVANLINQIQQSLNSGYDILKDIIHCSSLAQTSPLLLPLDQIDLIQNKIRKVSMSILDPDFVKMQSIVVSDPGDPHLLLVIINVAALDREEMQLTKLVSIPYYENEKAYYPILDYDTVVLHQLKRSYSVLTEAEEIGCLSDRCYVSDVERPISDGTCGIPQFFDEYKKTCLAEEDSSTTGVFLKPMLPDGVLFAFRDEVTTQLFCQGAPTGPSNKLQGTGILQLPNGCLLSIIDQKGDSTKVKGPPIYRMMSADDLALVVNGPLSPTHSSSGGPGAVQKKATYDGMITSHLSTVFSRMQSTSSRLDTQDNFIWSMVGVLIALIIITTGVCLLLYRYSGRFRQKIRDLRDRFSDLNRRLLDFVRTGEAMTRGLPPPMLPMSPSVTRILTRARVKLAQVKPRSGGDSKGPSPYVSSHNIYDDGRDNTYTSFQPVDGLRRGTQSHPYPVLDPLLLKSSDYEMQELDRDEEEMEALCKQSERPPYSQINESQI